MSTLLFDLDGTLLDVRSRHYAVYTGLLEEMGVAPLPKAVYWRRRRAGRSSSALLPESLGEQFRRGWMERIEQREMLLHDRLYTGARQALESLGRKHRLVMITMRHDRAALSWQLDSLGLSTHFPAVITPPPGATSKAGLWSGEAGDRDVKVIGDSEADIELATAAGAECICLTHGVRSERFLRDHGAGRLVSSLHALLKGL